MITTRLKMAMFLAIAAMGVFLTSCGKTCYCNTQELGLRYVGFPFSQTDTVVVYRYSRNSSFGSAIDTTTLAPQNANFAVTADTLSISGEGLRQKIWSLNDYILYLPAINRRDTIRSIYEVQEQVEGGSDLECNCTNRIISYRHNDSTYKARDPWNPAVYIYR
jgi:hypothetical protein